MKRTNRVYPQSYVKASSDIKTELAKLVEEGKVPRDGSIILDSGYDTYYWKIEYVGDPEDYENVNDFISNGIFALELPDDPVGGMAWGDLNCSRNGDWEYSSYEEAEANGFGNHSDEEEW